MYGNMCLVICRRQLRGNYYILRARETTRVAADSSLVSDKRTCSVVNDHENILPRRVNRCDIVSARDLPEIFLGELNTCSVVYARQMSGNYYLLRAGNYPGCYGQQLGE